MQVNSTLKKILDERNLSIRKVASDTGIAFESVRRIYNNDTERFPRDVLAKLCAYLDVGIADLLELEKADRQD